MNGSIRVARILGIPIVVNLSWLITLAFVTSILALQVYPEVFPPRSPHRDDRVLHWVMALASGFSFFASIVLHELAHSIVAKRQGIPVKNITLFIFGGVSQIGGEAKRPLYEFIMAVIGPLTSLALAGLFFGVWWLLGSNEAEPVPIVLEWLFLMNLIVAAFNMAPGFPMDGGRVLRSIIWGISGNLFKATRLATLVGRSMGYSLMFIGAIAFFGLIDFIDSWSGAWFGILGLFIESQARQAWFQAKALHLLSEYRAEDVMSADLATAYGSDELRYLVNRGGRRFIYFVADDDENVVGVLTEREAEPAITSFDTRRTAAEVMRSTSDVSVAAPREDGASMLQRMEAEALWHMPVVKEGRVIGVVSKEALLRLLARAMIPRNRLPTGQAGPAA
ncbi:MAG TPA: site-2 protease family protein [Dehalococcoidia bacterium]|nr:site-2 protease family protein [Dehalococcoidia bacterium]